MESNNHVIHSSCAPLAEHLYILEQNKLMQNKLLEIEAKLTAKDDLIQTLLEQLKLINNLKFGKQTEISKKIIGAANDDSSEESTDDNDPPIEVSAHQRKRGKKDKGRLVDTSKLPRYQIIHDLIDGHNCCITCGNLLQYLGQEISEQLEIIPKLVYVVEYVRYKYSCKNCEKVVMAPKEPAPLPKALAGASLITDAIMNKISYHLPCYRQSKILENSGITIPDNTIGSWILDAGVALSPLGEALWQEVEKSKYLQVDETPVKILKPEKNGYVWIYYNPLLKFVVYDFALTREGKNPEQRLKNFIGKLQTDGFTGYNKLHEKNSNTAFGCNTHARRKFTDVVKVTKSKKGIAAEAIVRLQELYAVEEEARTRNLDIEARKQLRQEKAKPIWDQYITWLKEQAKLVPPKSRIGGAIQYTLNRVTMLIAYLEHGEVEIDTNGVENLVRPIALGRKNWLFVGNEDSAQNQMLWFSLIQGCILHEINPRIYIHYVLTKVHAIRRGEISPRDLLPHHINKHLLELFDKKQLELQKKVLNSLSLNNTS